MIRVMTYNTRGGLGMDGRRSVRRIAGVVRECGADIVCLQEVHQRLLWSGFRDQPRLLARYLGYEVLFRRNLNIGIGGFGNAILSSLPIEFFAHHPLTSRGERRGALEARFTTGRGPLTVFCTHFGLHEGERAVQAQELTEITGCSPPPRIVCGDFNEEPYAPAVSRLIESASLVDAASRAGPTFDSVNPRYRIDLILCDPGLKILSARVPDTQASDHRPVVVDIEMQDRQ